MLITPIRSKEDIAELSRLAGEIWREHFTTIITSAQIEYMLSRFLSEDAIVTAAADGAEYYFASADGKAVGFIAVKEDGEKLFLSKLYLLKSARNKGYASEMFRFVLSRAADKKSVYLTCNKHNEHSLVVYRHWGFEVKRSFVQDIGDGFVMDDYLMERKT